MSLHLDNLLYRTFSLNNQLDFTKTFNSVDESPVEIDALLLRELVQLGFDNVSVRWLTCNLSNHLFLVRNAAALSSEFTSFSGIRKVPYLGPIYSLCLLMTYLRFSAMIHHCMWMTSISTQLSQRKVNA